METEKKIEIFVNLIAKIESITNFTEQEIETILKAFMQDNYQVIGKRRPILRAALADSLQRPPVFAMVDVLRKNNSVARLHN